MTALRSPLLAPALAAALLTGPIAARPPVPPAAAPLASTASPGTADKDRQSLEDLLRELRQRRDAYLAELRGRTEALVARLEAAAEAREKDVVEEVRQELLELGPEAAPLFVPYLSAPKGNAGKASRARIIAEVLAQLGPDTVLEPLFGMLRSRRRLSIQNALVALSTSAEPERVGALVREILPDANDAVREACLRTLASLGGEENLAIVVSALSDSEKKVVDTALRALASGASPEAAAKVLETITRDPERAGQQLQSLLYFYKSSLELIDEDHLEGLIQLAESTELNTDQRVAVIGFFDRLEDEFGSSEKKRLKELSKHPRRDIAQEALTILALFGDSRARRDLFKPLDETIEKNRNWYEPYLRRAEKFYRIRDYSNAIRDFKRALDLAEKNPRIDTSDIHVGLARTYARKGRLKDAAGLLERAPITLVRLRALAQEEAFEELREHPQHGKVFR